MTDKEWNDLMTEIQSLRFQLVHNMVLPTEREKLQAHLKALLEKLVKDGGQP